MSGPGRPGERAALLPAAVVLFVAALHLLFLAPAISRSYPADDTLLLVPSLLDNLEGRSPWGTVAYFVGADQKLPRALWKVYVLVSLWAFGPSHSALVWLGVAVHAMASALVWSLSRRLGLPAPTAWCAAGLHFTAYLGCQAYLWPVGVQHALTVLGILGVLDLYLATDQRRRASRPHRGLYWTTVAVALLSSLSRAPSAIGPLAVLAHAVLAPGSAAERLRRYDVWRPAMLASLLYPVALVVYGGDAEALSAFPRLSALQRLLEWRVGPAATFALGVAWVMAMLVALRLTLSLMARRNMSLRPTRRLRRGLVAAGALLAAPWLLEAAVVLVWGVVGFAAPLGVALNSLNTERWHLITFPLDLGGAILAGAVVLGLGRSPALGRSRSTADVIGLAILFGAFSLMLYGADARPNRYWIYVTPALAVALGAALEALRRAAARISPGRRIWPALLALWAIVAFQNVMAVRLDLWRHKVADTYQALDYVRAAELIRRDVEAMGAKDAVPICIEGLEPLPNEREWHQWFAHRGAFHGPVVRAILAQALGRRDASGLSLGCRDAPAGAYRYTMAGAAVLRDGKSIDAFDALDRRVRDLVTRGDHAAARKLIDDPSRPRAFVIDYLLERMPDDDTVWATNGASLLAWGDRVAASHDYWYRRRAPKIDALRALVTGEVTAYTRFLFLARYVETRTAPARTGWDPPSRRLPFGGLTMRELDGLLRSDPLVAADPAMLGLLDEVVTIAPSSPAAKGTGVPRVSTDLAFLEFIGRLARADLAWWGHR